MLSAAQASDPVAFVHVRRYLAALGWRGGETCEITERHGSGNFAAVPALAAELVAWAASARLPAVYENRFSPMIGGMASYGADLRENYRVGASYVDRILRGARPADLPVVLPTRFELVLNLAAIAELGLTVPPTLLARADEVIE